MTMAQTARLHDDARVNARCNHCGTPVPSEELRLGDELQFCCNGCRHVYGFLRSEGLDRNYYRLRRADSRENVPATVTGRRFTDFDNDIFEKAHVETLDSGHKRTRLFLEGVHCAACVWLVERLGDEHEGVVRLRLDLPRATAEIEWNPQVTALSAIARRLDAYGYAPHAVQSGGVADLRRREERGLLVRLGVAAACAMNIMLIEVALYAGEYEGIAPHFREFFSWVSFLLCLPVVFYAALPFFSAALAGLKNRFPHMDLPISLGISSGFIYSTVSVLSGEGPIYFDSTSALVALLLAGRYVQQRSQRAAVELSERMQHAGRAEFARKRNENGTFEEVPPEALVAGDLVEVLSGDTLPADGNVVEGRSSLDASILTGESRPVRVEAGAEVVAGAVNLGGRLIVRVDAEGERTRLGRLMKLVEEASGRRAKIVATADVVSRYFVSAVLVLAALTAAIWLVRDPARAMEHVIALLVVTCPCALGLATPVAVSVALARAAKTGIYIKDADVLERLRRVDRAAFDKTGTLTGGRLELVHWDGDDATARLAFAVERQSSHPLARALRSRFRALETSIPEADSVEERLGRGIEGRVERTRVALGNANYLESLGISVTEAWRSKVDDLAERAWTPVFVAVDGQVCALAGFADPLRPEAKEFLEKLRKKGWALHLFSGDSPLVASTVGRLLGFGEREIRGGVSPEDKHDLVRTLKQEARKNGNRVLMIGDGVNDAAALAEADVGIAVQGGSGASIGAAHVTLTQPGLEPVAELLEGSRRTLRIIYRNLLFSLGYNLVCATLAMMGKIDPLAAAVLMPISSLTVISYGVLGRSFGTRRRAASA